MRTTGRADHDPEDPGGAKRVLVGTRWPTSCGGGFLAIPDSAHSLDSAAAARAGPQTPTLCTPTTRSPGDACVPPGLPTAASSRQPPHSAVPQRPPSHSQSRAWRPFVGGSASLSEPLLPLTVTGPLLCSCTREPQWPRGWSPRRAGVGVHTPLAGLQVWGCCSRRAGGPRCIRMVCGEWGARVHGTALSLRNGVLLGVGVQMGNGLGPQASSRVH